MVTPSTARSLHGRLSLRFAREGGRTVLGDAERSPPWHIQRLLHLNRAHPALAEGVLLNTTAGLFAGDRLHLAVDVAGGAQVALTTPTVTRAYAMPEGDAESTTRLTVAAGGYLEYLPAPTLLCHDADLRQRLDLDTEAGAVAAVGEVLAFGRTAHGEGHDYRALHQRTELRCAGEIVLAEALALTPGESPDGPGLLGPYRAYGSLNLLCSALDADALLAETRLLLAGRANLRGGASLLWGQAGVAIRVLGPAPHAVHAMLRAITERFRARCCP